MLTTRTDIETPETTRTLSELYDEWRASARAIMRGERVSHTLSPTALVNEALLELEFDEDAAADPARVALVAAVIRTVMAHNLIDYAAKKKCLKRGGGRVRTDLETVEILLHDGERGLKIPDLVAFRSALECLETDAPHLAHVIDLRFFCGLTCKEVGERIDCSEQTVHARSKKAYRRLEKYLGFEAAA